MRPPLIAIDPGTDVSAVVIWDGITVLSAFIESNESCIEFLKQLLNHTNENQSEYLGEKPGPLSENQKHSASKDEELPATHSKAKAAVSVKNKISSGEGSPYLEKEEQTKSRSKNAPLSQKEPRHVQSAGNVAEKTAGISGEIQQIPQTLEQGESAKEAAILSSSAFEAIAGEHANGGGRFEAKDIAIRPVSLLPETLRENGAYRAQNPAIKGRGECCGQCCNSLRALQSLKGEKDGKRIHGISVAVEMIQSFGMPVGREVFETCLVIGRILEICASRNVPCRLVFRKDVKLHHCGTSKAKDANIRQSLIDKYGAPGVKKAQGVTYGIKSHLWAAFAVATYVTETGALVEIKECE